MHEAIGGPRGERTPTKYCGAAIAGILRTLGVDSWEKLPGCYCRVLRDRPRDKIAQIGHFIKDKWFDPTAIFA